MSDLCMHKRRDGTLCPLRSSMLIEADGAPRAVCGRHVKAPASFTFGRWGRDLDPDGLWPEALEACAAIYRSKSEAALRTSASYAERAVALAVQAEDFRHLAMDRRAEWEVEP